MDQHSIPEKPLVASMDHKKYPPQRTFYFERKDGSSVCVEEREAWELHRKGFKFLGSSDGTKFALGVEEAQRIFRDTQDIEKAKERVRQGEREEFEAAKGNMVYPRNFDTVDRTGRPVDMRNLR